MNCMKCGREIESEQVFCASCLTDMEKYPVKPGTVIQLPNRSDAQSVRKAAHRKRAALTPEEQIARLKKRNRVLWMCLSVALALIVVLCIVAGDVISKLDMQKLLGQNYSTVVTTNPPETESVIDVTEIP